MSRIQMTVEDHGEKTLELHDQEDGHILTADLDDEYTGATLTLESYMLGKGTVTVAACFYKRDLIKFLRLLLAELEEDLLNADQTQSKAADPDD